METILKLSGLTELEFKKIYLKSKNLLITLGHTEKEAIEITGNLIYNTIKKIHEVK
jgi:hypothetical protein